ncbi:uncharacterized protein [Panulirus ornatus]|uniref:uncharacterized protein isoform X2 n=1 Tax=Panulirus ornatus TaxID=150431 RepID=UPI003A855DE6
MGRPGGFLILLAVWASTHALQLQDGGEGRQDDLNLQVVRVSSHYVELVWDRHVLTSVVVVTAGDTKCTGTAASCNNTLCTLSSTQLSDASGVCQLPSCSRVTISVSSSIFTSVKKVTTAPNAAEGLKTVAEDDALHIEWDLRRSGNECFRKTIVRTKTPLRVYTQEDTQASGHIRREQMVSACDAGLSTVVVEVYGGDGSSDAVTDTVTYTSNGSLVSQLDVESESHQITVSWSLKARCPRVTQYSVTWKTGNTVQGSYTMAMDYTITNLRPCTDYTVSVQPLEGKEPLARPVSDTVATAAGAPPAPPSVTCRESMSSSELTVEWVGCQTTCALSGYLVTYAGNVLWSNGSSFQVAHVGPDVRHVTASSTPWTTYTVCVAGTVAGDYDGASNCCNVTTQEAEPGTPAYFNQTTSGTSSVSVSWGRPVEVNGRLSGYHLKWEGTISYLPATISHYTIHGLDEASRYNVTLQARTGAGLGAPLSLEVTTKDGVTTKVWVIVAGVVLGALLLVGAVDACVIWRKRRNSPPRHRSSTMNTAVGDIRKTELQDHIAHLESHNKRFLKVEFAQLKAQSPWHSTSIASLEANRHKNRFVDILPFNMTRVTLSTTEDGTGTDYINASYVEDVQARRYFVATQAPIPNTTEDFWRMVWQLNVYTIIMLTRVMEKGKEICAQYWPSMTQRATTIGSFQVLNQGEEYKGLSTTRYLQVVKGSEKRVVKQYHFTNWPDFDAPDNEHDLLDFICDIQNTMIASGEHIIVHCRAGVGRTGTFIGLWKLMDTVKGEWSALTVNVMQTVLSMRKCRPCMVQAPDQYLYLYKCIAAYIKDPARWRHVAEDWRNSGSVNEAFQEADHAHM